MYDYLGWLVRATENSTSSAPNTLMRCWMKQEENLQIIQSKLMKKKSKTVSKILLNCMKFKILRGSWKRKMRKVKKSTIN